MFRQSIVKCLNRSGYNVLCFNCKYFNQSRVPAVSCHSKLLHTTNITSQYKNYAKEEATYFDLDNEKEFIVKAKNDPDVFGTGANFDAPLVDKGDIADEEYHQVQPLRVHRLGTKQYADIIKSLLAKVGIEAIIAAQINSFV